MDPATTSPPAAERAQKCVHCGYRLESLAQGQYGEVMCPECGVKNLPERKLESNWGDEFGWWRMSGRKWVEWLIISLIVMVIGAALYIIFR